MHTTTFDIPYREDAGRIPNPSHRHAAPSAPWPWVDLNDEVDQEQLNSELPPVPPLCDHRSCGDVCWRHYPQSRFPNWTERQVRKSKILEAVKEYDREKPCKLFYVDVDDQGKFSNADETIVTEQKIAESWRFFVDDKRPPRLRVRAIFIENLSRPVLQMLGARFNIEPFFWSSSLNWIPSRYQEDPQHSKGDHITICLTFLRSMPKDTDALRMDAAGVRKSSDSVSPSTLSQMMIDTQAPLPLSSSGQLLVLDLLSIHLIRNIEGSTILSYHPSLPLPTTTAKDLHQRIRFAGQSVYWQKMYQKTSDPTFVLLTFLWHALYAWDEALENLYTHICTLETKVIETSQMSLTSELHVIRAHQLHYQSLLESFTKTVEFIQNTPNPSLSSMEREERELTESMMKRECSMLLNEIRRLNMSRKMQHKRLKNVMNLVFSSVNIMDSRRMQKMTEAAVRDSEAMKQIAYLTMIFLPSSLIAAVFGMNVKEISPDTHGTLRHYFGTALALTLATIWIIVAFQSQYLLPENHGFLKRLGWPVLLIGKQIGWMKFEDEAGKGEKAGGQGGEEKAQGSGEIVVVHNGGMLDGGHGHGHLHVHTEKQKQKPKKKKSKEAESPISIRDDARLVSAL